MNLQRIRRFFKRISLTKTIRRLEIELNDKLICLDMVKDKQARNSMIFTIECVQEELAKVRSEYIAMMPPGFRMTWELA